MILLIIYLAGFLFVFLSLLLGSLAAKEKPNIVDVLAMTSISLLSWGAFLFAIFFIISEDIKNKREYAKRLEDWKKERAQKEVLQ